MPNESHCLLFRDAVASEARNDGNTRAMKGEMRQPNFAEKTMPISRALRRHIVGGDSAFFSQSAEEGPQSRNKRSRMASPALDRKGNLIGPKVDVLQRKARFSKSAALADSNFKRNTHPLRILSAAFGAT